MDFQSLIDDQDDYSFQTFDGDEPEQPPNIFRDAPSASGLPQPAATASPHCPSNRKYRFGVARRDITGPWAGRARAGYEAPVELLSGLNQRVYARAFVIGEDCTGNSVVIVNADLGFMHRSVRDAVVQGLAADPKLASIDPNSLLLSSTHTHNFSGGFSHDVFFSGLHGGHKPDVLKAIADGIVEAIGDAWARYEQATPGEISLAMNELLHTNSNRHPSGYRENTQAERNLYLDINGNDQLTNLTAVQLNLKNGDGRVNGLLNWYAVHPTAGLLGTLAHGDSKGHAAFELERRLNHPDAATALPQPFVAGMLQSDEGDVVPVRYIDNLKTDQPRLPPLLTAALGEDVSAEHANVALSGIRQAANALTLIDQKTQHQVRGSIDYRMRYYDFTEQVVTDPVILGSMQHPPELDADPKRTCDPLYGLSSVGKEAFGKYQSCDDALNVPVEEFLADLASGNVQRSFGDAAKVALCALGDLDLSPVGGPDYSCQAEKGHLFGLGDKGPVFTQVDQPFQIIRIGNVAIVALPWEITTMSGRRIRATVLNELKTVGVDFVVIAGLSNEYTGYLTTREEYARQGYEGSSNQYGPWTLAAVMQNMRAIALDMIAGAPRYPVEGFDPIGARIPNALVTDPARVDTPTRGAFTTPINNVAESYSAGERLRFSYQAGFPNNNTYRNGRYFEVQRQLPTGDWVNWVTDAEPETTLHWSSNSPGAYVPPTDSVLEVDWFITWDTPPGNYRIVYRTAAKELPGSAALTEYEATTRVFKVVNDNPRCASGAS